MAEYKFPQPVKLVIGSLSASIEDWQFALSHLKEKFGTLGFSMEPIPFTYTNYYEEEIGNSPYKSFVSFETLIPRESMVEIKRWTNELELSLFSGKRKVNLDPGYMTLGQFFLATTKDQRHRVYIKDGIFMETTLFYEAKQWKDFAWTYYDYRSQEYKEYFQEVRKELSRTLKNY